MTDDFLKLVGSRILSELNDLKRTPEACATEVGMDAGKLNSILSGDCKKEETYELINKIGLSYPIDVSDLHLIEDDCKNGVRIMREEESKETSRIFDRKDKTGERTDYYDYRDTAMSKLSGFKPEWIKELRYVENSDPNNLDVAYNNGHFMHQMTFFIGPVNFYYEVNGKRYCEEMNTGDSNYITPFWPHSFTNRSKEDEALIIAVTFGGDISRAQKEFYALGERAIEGFTLDYRNHNKAVSQLIKQHMDNERISLESLRDLDGTIDDRILDENQDKSFEDLQKIANVLNIEISDLMIPDYKPNEEVVVVKRKDEEEGYFYPNAENKNYRLHPLARSSKMPFMKGFEIEVLSKEKNLENGFYNSLHTYVYNYGDSDLDFSWIHNGETFNDILRKGDSMYIQPFIRHAFSNNGEENGRIATLGISGAINLSTQKELSYLPSGERVANETKKWFD
ncbi:hypothetical protein CL617_03620 [archaeon]|nr:hypothetical protein [archaeon]|tara:strand:- start:3207 stop:4565 length:1359 start_codon:yes stop_codon:yes gene_type:complete